MKHLPVLFGYHASNLGNSHVPLSLCRHWNEAGKRSILTVPSRDDGIDYPWLRPVMHGMRKVLVYRLGNTAQPRIMAENAFFRTESSSSPVYLWAGLSLDIFERFSAKGAKIIIERINCHRATSRAILREATEFWNMALTETFSDEEIDTENRKLLLADAVFCPSLMVNRSMLDNGVAASKLLSTSYGWSPERFPSLPVEPPDNPKPRFLFAGTLCLRKGVLLLLEAWTRAGIDGELLLCGGIDPAIAPLVETYLGKHNIRHIAYTRDIGQVYRTADVFLFPSLEEGGPMVTYEAMAHAIPPLVTAMGGGAIVEDGLNGVVLPDMDIDAWAEAIGDFACDRDKRIELGRKARERAAQFTWDKVAARRAALLEARYPQLWKEG